MSAYKPLPRKLPGRQGLDGEAAGKRMADAVPSTASSSPAAGRSERRKMPRVHTFTAADYPPPGAAAPRSSLAGLSQAERARAEASHFYFDTHFQHNAVKVGPGEYFVSREDLIIVTVLGSCIAACLWDRAMRVGGMNHFMLPEGDGTEASARYGCYAMELLINELLKRGARRETLQAKIFGGAQVMQGLGQLSVGERNTAFVTQYLHTERIPVISEDVLDVHARRLVFFPASGKAMVKRLGRPLSDEQQRMDHAQGSALEVARRTAGGSVDLF